MRTVYFYLAACVLFFTSVSCQKTLPEEDICAGLLQNGTADSASFVKPGTDWEFKYFAYTPNGKDIIYKEAVPGGLFRTTARTDSLRYYYYNEGLCVPTFFASTNKLKMRVGAWSMVYVPKEMEIQKAFNSAICYAIQGDMLYVHFREFDGKNLFILQRK